MEKEIAAIFILSVIPRAFSYFHSTAFIALTNSECNNGKEKKYERALTTLSSNIKLNMNVLYSMKE